MLTVCMLAKPIELTLVRLIHRSHHRGGEDVHRHTSRGARGAVSNSGHHEGDASGMSGSEDLRSRLQRRRRVRHNAAYPDSHANGATVPSSANAATDALPRRVRNDREERRRDASRRGGGMRSDIGSGSGQWQHGNNDRSKIHHARRTTRSPVPTEAIPQADANDRWDFDG
jgi:hypothetical protein